MNREKQVKQEIRAGWFKDHIAELEDHGDLKVLRWKKPGTICYYCRFVFDGNRMYISGDIGEAVFNLTWQADVHSFNGISTHYFMEKMSAYSGDRYDYDSKEAEKYLKSWFKENMRDKQFKTRDDRKEFVERFNELVEAASNSNNEEQWAWEYVNGEFSDFVSEMDADYWEWLYHVGRVVPYRILGYIVALQMASEQLKAKEADAKCPNNTICSEVVKK